MSSVRRFLALTAAVAVLVVAGASGAQAHEERESTFPPGKGTTPTYRPYDATKPHLVVCKSDSAARIKAIADPKVRAFNNALLPKCAFEPC